MRKTLSAIAIAALLSACSAANNDTDTAQTTAENTAMATITAADLQHHNWKLVAVNGNKIDVPEGFGTPNLEIGEKMTANGNAGCNNFFGKAELKDGKIRIAQMGSTMKMCPEEVMNYEMAMGKGLGEWSTITLTKETMTLANDVNTLEFVLRDWVN